LRLILFLKFTKIITDCTESPNAMGTACYSYQRRQRKKVGKQASFLQLVILNRLRVLPRVSARSWKQAMQDCHVPSSANLMPSYLSPRDMSSSFDPAPSFLLSRFTLPNRDHSYPIPSSPPKSTAKKHHRTACPSPATSRKPAIIGISNAYSLSASSATFQEYPTPRAR
jgi:hypothetical protein